MGFWKTVDRLVKGMDKIGKVGGVAVDKTTAAGERYQQHKSAANERYQQHKNEMSSKTDSDLFKIIKQKESNSSLEAKAASQELRDRGYSSERE